MSLTRGRSRNRIFLVLENLSKIPIFWKLLPRCNLDFGLSTPPARINQTDSKAFCFYVGFHIFVRRLLQENKTASCRQKPNFLFLIFFTFFFCANWDCLRQVAGAGRATARNSVSGPRECTATVRSGTRTEGVSCSLVAQVAA